MSGSDDKTGVPWELTTPEFMNETQREEELLDIIEDVLLPGVDKVSPSDGAIDPFSTPMITYSNSQESPDMGYFLDPPSKHTLQQDPTTSPQNNAHCGLYLALENSGVSAVATPVLKYASAAAIGNTKKEGLLESLRGRDPCPERLYPSIPSAAWFFVDEPNVRRCETIPEYFVVKEDKRIEKQHLQEASIWKIYFNKMPPMQTGYTITWTTSRGINLQVTIHHSKEAPPQNNASNSNSLINETNGFQMDDLTKKALAHKIYKLIDIVARMDGDEKRLMNLTPEIRTLIKHITFKIHASNQTDPDTFGQLPLVLFDLETCTRYPQDVEHSRLGRQATLEILKEINAIPPDTFELCLPILKPPSNNSVLKHTSNAPAPLLAPHRVDESYPVFEGLKKRKHEGGSSTISTQYNTHDIDQFFSDIEVLEQFGPRVYVNLAKLYQATVFKNNSFNPYWYNLWTILKQYQYSDGQRAPLDKIRILVNRLGGERRLFSVLKDLYHPSIYRFYYGGISSGNAVSILQGSPAGSYLLRDPTDINEIFLLAISYVDVHVEHARIYLTDTGYAAEKFDRTFKYYEKLEALLKDVKNIKIEKGVPTDKWMHIDEDAEIEVLNPEKYRGVNLISSMSNMSIDRHQYE